jgi:hypothetical protein
VHFFPEKVIKLNLAKHCMGNTLGDFSTKASGHPGPRRLGSRNCQIFLQNKPKRGNIYQITPKLPKIK